MQVTLYVQVNPDYLRWIKPDDMTVEAVIKQASFSTAQFDTYIQLGTVSVDVELDLSGFTDKAIASLRIKQANIRAEATKECTKIESMVQQLLCIENKPSAPERPMWDGGDGEPMMFGDFP